MITRSLNLPGINEKIIYLQRSCDKSIEKAMTRTRIFLFKDGKLQSVLTRGSGLC